MIGRRRHHDADIFVAHFSAAGVLRRVARKA
jgi:hypothetical protein